MTGEGWGLSPPFETCRGREEVFGHGSCVQWHRVVCAGAIATSSGSGRVFGCSRGSLALEAW